MYMVVKKKGGWGCGEERLRSTCNMQHLARYFSLLVLNHLTCLGDDDDDDDETANSQLQTTDPRKAQDT